jgi:hypothetical protein
MIYVYQLTEEQANSLLEVEFIPDNYFNPIQDNNGNWVISTEEVEQCSIDWVKELTLIEYVPFLNTEDDIDSVNFK